jgi:hypothetical protein
MHDRSQAAFLAPASIYYCSCQAFNKLYPWRSVLLAVVIKAGLGIVIMQLRVAGSVKLSSFCEEVHFRKLLHRSASTTCPKARSRDRKRRIVSTVFPQFISHSAYREQPSEIANAWIGLQSNCTAWNSVKNAVFCTAIAYNTAFSSVNRLIRCKWLKYTAGARLWFFSAHIQSFSF